ncbi:MAG: radical SAM protein [Clostridia bacterium]|nr:radical SAM protein [Clostridia bacterium]
MGETMLALVAINAKYCHTSLSVRSLASYIKSRGEDAAVFEFTINDSVSNIIKKLAMSGADTFAFSCYIWNIAIVNRIAVDLKIILPQAKVWLGGPEVSFDPQNYPFADKIFCGEGERTFLSEIKSDSGRVVRGEPIENLDELPFPYDDLEALDNRILYYESSRGCPYNCSYCLSSSFNGVRFKSLDKVFSDLKRFDDAKVRLVKFVDRTFNADRKRANRILDFILNECKNTSFHFEIEGELLDDEQIELLEKFPKGKVQLEIGVQSTDRRTLEAVRRYSDTDKLLDIIGRLSKRDNVHIHTDLIAGLPYETYDRFRRSFDELFERKPHCIQLGFLKLLKGSKMREDAKKWNYKFSAAAPYTVYSNDFLSFAEVKRLEAIEYLVDKLYNSGCFELSVSEAVKMFGSAFLFFEKLSIYMEERGLYDRPLSRKFLYSVIFDFLGGRIKTPLKIDWLLAEGRPAPGFLGGDTVPENYDNEKYGRACALFNKHKR